MPSEAVRLRFLLPWRSYRKGAEITLEGAICRQLLGMSWYGRRIVERIDQPATEPEREQSSEKKARTSRKQLRAVVGTQEFSE